MFREKIIDTVFSNPAHSIGINQSKCLRMRFNKSTCNKCRGICYAQAVTIGEGLSIKSETCSGCMLCVSSCPSDCFTINSFDFYSLIARLKKIQVPVLGCSTRMNLDAHEKTFCLGFLSEEHIIALSALAQRSLQINLTECAGCGNEFVADVLKKRLKSVETKTSINIFERIRLVQNRPDLNYREISYDRRDFFRAIKNFTAQKTADLFDNMAANDNVTSYSLKKLPFKRDLLNRAFSSFSKELQEALLKNYYYTVGIDESCNYCFACVGMCPTGALKISREESVSGLLFNCSLCIGCRLCENFCMNNSIRVVDGFCGDEPFEFRNAEEGVLC